MGQRGLTKAKDVARDVVDVLTAYEDELLAVEHEAPALAALRRAVGMAIAEACQVIGDEAAAPARSRRVH